MFFVGTHTVICAILMILYLDLPSMNEHMYDRMNASVKDVYVIVNYLL
jgi:hypothetical protein